jgi:diphthine-ammonia ligase
LEYPETKNDEVEDLFALLKEGKEKYPSVRYVSTGAIASDYQRERVESMYV